MIPRLILPQVDDALRRQAAVALIGPRQVGKTTLEYRAVATHPYEMVYVEIEAEILDRPAGAFAAQRNRVDSSRASTLPGAA